MNDHEKKELAIGKTLILIFLVVGVAGVVWLAWFHPLPFKSTVHSYQDCIDAGNPVQETYPETCTTKDGKHFTNEAQRKRLTITEWDVRFPIPASIQNLSYTIGDNPNVAALQLNDIDGACKGTNQIRRAKSGEDL